VAVRGDRIELIRLSRRNVQLTGASSERPIDAS
jgi:hypothetical protein